jgi:putative spermidine/putrescine transport system ATP-binding protein
VFNRGRIEQVGAPADVYERPETEFVAGFVGVSNVLERTLNGQPSRFTVRPEKIRILADHEQAENGAHVENGRVRDVVYVGMVTRYIVDLDAGGRLMVIRQNLETSSAEALEARGRHLRLQWRPEHTYVIEPGGGGKEQE